MTGESATLLGTARTLRGILDALHEAYAVLSLDGRILDENGGVSQLMQMPDAELAGTHVLSLVTDEDAAGLQRAIQEALAGRSADMTACLRPIEGPRVARRLRVIPVHHDGPDLLALVLEPPVAPVPITVSIPVHAPPPRLTAVDALTQLPRRSAVLAKLSGMLQLVATAPDLEGDAVAVLAVDLDHFKKVNDSIGHEVGDELLRSVAERLTSVAGRLAGSAVVARSGDDEFTVLAAIQPSTAAALAEEVLAALSRPHLIEAHELYVSASVGVAVHPDDGTEAELLLKNADTALVRAKAHGRNQIAFFRGSMRALAVRQLLLENELRRAIDRDELVLHYQPRVNLRSGEIRSAEALVRWVHPERGMISPGEFIPLAEQTGLIVPLGQWVLRTAARQSAAWATMGKPLRVAVNISGREFYEPNFVQTVLETVRDAGAAISNVELEVTESLAMEDVETASVVLQRLRDAGFYIALDDFGTGYSSITYLTRFPFHALKLDRSYVAQVATDTRLASIVHVLIGLAASLGLEVVAEGIEEFEQVSFLRDLNCHEAQGFLFARPLPAEEFTARYVVRPEGRFVDVTEPPVLGSPPATPRLPVILEDPRRGPPST